MVGEVEIAERRALAVMIRNRRASIGLQAQAVASALGVNRVTLFKWETAREPIPAERREQLERLFTEHERAAERFGRWMGRAA